MGSVALLAVLLALAAAAAAATTRPEINDKNAVLRGYSYSLNHKDSTHQALNGIIAEGCLYGGRWYAVGAAVNVRACMRCTCTSGGALTCARRACAPTPDPPSRCHLLHRRDACCPELHCPEGVTLLEHTGTSRADDDGAFTAPTHVFPVCVEEGVSYAAGSALDAHVACEQCFCLGGVRRCVSPRCLPPPLGCRARPAAGACCPTRYYCDHSVYTTPAVMSKGDCLVNGTRVAEGDRASKAESGSCERCFCLRGEVRCQPMACAPPLLDCTPLLRSGDCCPHRYQCHNTTQAARIPLSPNSWSASRTEYRSLPIAAKVKRKTGDPPPAPSTTTTQEVPTTTAVMSTTVQEEPTSLQTEGTVKIIMNGTINCTAELKSETGNETRIITADSSNQPGELFVVNVTSSLRANVSASSAPSSINISVPSVPSLATTAGDTNATKEDYEDYEYAEPTLPPSLPNLKIIPFVAADAVVEEDEPPPVPLTYPLLEREDNFPVYYHEDEQEQQEDAKNKTPITTSSEAPATTIAHSKAPAVNKFSPPVQTEGGFVPKGPGILGEYYAVYPSTSSPAPLLSTSMPLTASFDCVTSAGRRVLAGGVLQLPCQRCECLWGLLRCVPTPCAVPIAPPVLNVTYTPSSTTTTSTSKVTQTETTTTTRATTTLVPATKSVKETEQRTTVPSAVTHRITTAILSSTLSAIPLPSNDIGDGSSETSLQNHDTTPAEVNTTSSSTETPTDDQSEEEDDEVFSFGSVLKLLLSEYDTSSSSTTSTRRPPSSTPRPASPTTRRPSSTAPSSRRPPSTRPKPSISPPRPLPYTPPIKSYIPNSVNRIDHLVLGEATAIKQRVPVTTARPPPVSTVTSPATIPPTVRTTKYSTPPTRSTVRYSVPPVTIGPPLSEDAGNGLPKLAGCNIYGRMYRVGRVIAELSTPCQECRCTVAGVHCHALPC